VSKLPLASESRVWYQDVQKKKETAKREGGNPRDWKRKIAKPGTKKKKKKKNQPKTNKNSKKKNKKEKNTQKPTTKNIKGRQNLRTQKNKTPATTSQKRKAIGKKEESLLLNKLPGVEPGKGLLGGKREIIEQRSGAKKKREPLKRKREGLSLFKGPIKGEAISRLLKIKIFWGGG